MRLCTRALLLVFVTEMIWMVPGSAAAQSEVPELPDLMGALVDVRVSSDEPGVLRFEYRVDNSGGSLPVKALLVPLKMGPEEAPVSIDGLDDTAGALSAVIRDTLGLSTSDYVMVSYPSTPASWAVSTDALLRANWHAFSDAAIHW